VTQQRLPDDLSPDDILHAIERFSITDRGRQVALGPSEVGMACQRCICRKLAGLEKEQLVGSWRAQLGTYVHDNLANEFAARYPDQVIVEDRLFIHAYKTFILMGSCDAFFPRNGNGSVVDWKIVGDDTLADVTKWMSELAVSGEDLIASARRQGGKKWQYVVQGMLYALGWLLRGYNPTECVIMFLPANKGSVTRYAVPVRYQFDVTVAAEALGKIERYIDSAEELGWEAVLRQTPPAKWCLSCKAYEDVDDPIYDLTLRQ
jgi:hypothetical protein